MGKAAKANRGIHSAWESGEPEEKEYKVEEEKDP